MNTESVDCRNVGSYDAMKNPGDFYFAERDGHEGIIIILPYGGWHHIAVVNGPAGGNRVWGWNGDREKPTLTPSIRAGTDDWHGYLTAGRLVSC